MPDATNPKFESINLDTSPPIDSGLPPELWTIVQSSHASFPPHYFVDVSRNLVENPNLTASHLSRAEISYSSFADPTFNPRAKHPHDLAKIVRHLKPEHQPQLVEGGFAGYELEWTVVRKLIPRNPKLDQALLQTCHLFTSTADVVVGAGKENVKAERYMVVYLPHVSGPDEVPFYHPKVAALAILYTYLPGVSEGVAPGTLSLFYQLFPDVPLDNRLERTALRMLEVIHKHSRGRQAGYVKRVHHDQIVDKKRFGDTYAALKGRYAQDLIKGWVEQTPPEKHVFEDLGIAAFLIELWVDMYGGEDEASTSPPAPAPNASVDNNATTTPKDDPDTCTHALARAKAAFPGFVDIGCGNGLLVHILNTEGFHGWGFDARRRKTWSTFPSTTQFQLEELLLVPAVLTPRDQHECTSEYAAFETSGAESRHRPGLHDGLFGDGMFIVANHADELTVWTPLLASLSGSPFLAIPCCSHSFAGSKFRAPHKADFSFPASDAGDMDGKVAAAAKGGKQVSAYASFSSYVAYLSDRLGYVAEKEHLRIPSTRNVAIIGRKMKVADAHKGKTLEEKMDVAKRVVEEEMGGMSIEKVREEWVGRGEGLMKGKGGGH